MDEIKCLQDKHANVIPQLENFISQCGKHAQQVRQKEAQLLKENEEKIERLMSEVVAMKESVDIERQVLEHKNTELLKHNDSIAELKTKLNNLLEENQKLEAQKTLLKTTKPNRQDQLLLEQGKKKLCLYKELTGISWDYSTLEESIQGYVTNKSDYIHHFSFPKNEEDPDELSDLLWREIYLSIENTLSKENEENYNVKK